ncbi:hypothetical protein FKR81_04585 [Lentzea tibetensis]|uniref:Knr4/Smi1-like domain-containing protein n=1 Tax=Lentzea tibetensis TaxID=2591470 RepID=A0A563F0H3_9PSEU|nr:SMI1/KNR4 family protein [Lentzea tibetensis]TWP53251.1 hypothetical protein FKR81_04585 [Lentzea tibetensis]
MTAVTESWARIDAWLREHAPATFAKLAPPADQAEIARVQDEMELKFPQDLVDSLLCHDGMADYSDIYVLPEHYPLLSVAQILEHWHDNGVINGQHDDQASETQWFHPRWIPIASIEGDSQIIDTRDGRLGEHFSDQGGYFGPGTWTSLRAYLSATAEALLNGTDVKGRYPHVDENGEVLWVELADTEGWGRTLNRLPAEVSA